MSTEEKKHKYTDLPALTVVYIRNAVNNPAWASGLEDWILGCDTLRTIPKIVIPKGLQEDATIFDWADKTPVSFTLSDKERDTVRTALKKAFELKALPINEYSASLIHHFSLK